MAKCGCAGSTCACKVVAGSGVSVTGTGTVQDPITVSLGTVDIDDNIEVDSTTNITVAKTGSGTALDPTVITVTLNPGVDITSVPVTAGSTTIDDDTNLQYFDHPATIATHTINLPDSTNSMLKEITFVFRSIITTLTVAAPGTTDVSGMPTTAAAGSFLKVRLVGTTWRRVG